MRNGETQVRARTRRGPHPASWVPGAASLCGVRFEAAHLRSRGAVPAVLTHARELGWMGRTLEFDRLSPDSGSIWVSWALAVQLLAPGRRVAGSGNS